MRQLLRGHSFQRRALVRAVRAGASIGSTWGRLVLVVPRWRDHRGRGRVHRLLRGEVRKRVGVSNVPGWPVLARWNRVYQLRPWHVRAGISLPAVSSWLVRTGFGAHRLRSLPVRSDHDRQRRLPGLSSGDV